ncbi:aminotransferase class V-fold PLP-dependent enzyme [Psychromonas algicola]|uniref:aminotransferase class V-fold PLP-dependent enzyme n=1 Tax=Psychromonas algicola TaxID=2555642 RepID=UPI001067C306|nr:cysteine desulfurase [Psychromonas sp. RZ5]TEW50636.1 cysteine desulfurase [Psychromonas sp. RZ5]
MSSASYIEQLRNQFPILDQHVNDHPLVYLDNAATTQKPQSVIDAICDYYLHSNANVHRASHALSNRSTQLFEASREKVKSFLNAQRSEEIIWTKGTTEGINLLANVFAEQLTAGDEIIISALEHHANIVPWQLLASKTGAVIRVVPLASEQTLDMQAFQRLLNVKTKLVSIAHVSNALGIINPIKDITELAHQQGAKVIIDGAQAVAHLAVDVQQLDCDFYLFSGHKLFAPTGVGVLYGKYDLLNKLPVWQGGGEMIKSVSFEETTYNELPFKFEAGTPNISGVIALGAAIDFVNDLNRNVCEEYEKKLLEYTENALNQIAEVTVLANGVAKSGAISFIVNGEHSADIAMLLNAQGIAVRSGAHCAMPLMQHLHCNGTVRVSFSVYNTLDEAKAFISSLNKVIELLVD